MHDPSTPRRRVALAAVAVAIAAGGLLPVAAGAGDAAAAYPQKPLRLVVPFPAGGGSDIIARLLGRELSTMWGQPVVVENKPGASGTIGAGAVAKAAPDGYTLLLGATPLVQLQTVFKSLPYDTFRDFAPLARIALSSDVFATPASAQIGSVRELLAKAKAEAGKYSYGSYGNGTSAHMHGELLRMQAHVDLTHVAYKGGAPLVQDLMSGQVTSGFVDASGYHPAMGSAKVRPLAVTGERRLRGLPDVPTFTELGYRDFEPNGWYGLFVPAATPKAIRDKLSVAVLAALAKPDLEKAIREQGLESGTLGPEAFATVLRRDAEIWARIATAAKITAD